MSIFNTWLKQQIACRSITTDWTIRKNRKNNVKAIINSQAKSPHSIMINRLEGYILMRLFFFCTMFIPLVLFYSLLLWDTQEYIDAANFLQLVYLAFITPVVYNFYNYEKESPQFVQLHTQFLQVFYTPSLGDDSHVAPPYTKMGEAPLRHIFTCPWEMINLHEDLINP